MNIWLRLLIVFMSHILVGCGIPNNDINDALQKYNNKPTVNLEIRYTPVCYNSILNMNIPDCNEVLVTSLDNSNITINSVNVNNRSHYCPVV